MPTHLTHSAVVELCRVAVAAASAAGGASRMRTRDYRARLIGALRSAGWRCRTGARVASRGTEDGYGGVLELVAYPPAPEGCDAPPPVLVEVDGRTPRQKSAHKLLKWPYPASGRVIVLTRAATAAPVRGIDIVLCLG